MEANSDLGLFLLVFCPLLLILMLVLAVIVAKSLRRQRAAVRQSASVPPPANLITPTAHERPQPAPVPPPAAVVDPFPALEAANLTIHNPELIAMVNAELDAAAARGTAGVDLLLDRLYRDLVLFDGHAHVGFTGDLAWNEWMKKQAVARALGRAQNPAAVQRLGRLLSASCSVGMYYDLLIPAVIDALAATGGDEALRLLKLARGEPALNPGNLNQLDAVLKTLENGRPAAEERDEDGRTALHRAAYDGDAGTVVKLLEQGAQVDARDKDDKTPLFLAAGKGHLDACKALVEHGADLEAVGCVFTDRRYYYPPLLNAIEGKHRDVIRFLLDKGANPNVRNEPLKSSTLHRAAESGMKDVVEWLIEKGAQVNPRSWTGKTPYTRALDMNYDEIAEYIRQHGGMA